MIPVGIVGAGKMGLSHLSIVNTRPDVRVVVLCDATRYVLEVMAKYTGLATFSDHHAMMEEAKPDAVIVATPSKTHGETTRDALRRGLHASLLASGVIAPEEAFEYVCQLPNIPSIVFGPSTVRHIRQIKQLTEGYRERSSMAVGQDRD